MRNCPFCQASMDEEYKSIIEDLKNAPDPLEIGNLKLMVGVATLCDACGEPVMFDEDEFRKPTDDEYPVLADNPQIQFFRSVFEAKKTYEKKFDKLWQRAMTVQSPDGKTIAGNAPNEVRKIMEAMMLFGALSAMRLCREIFNNLDSGYLEDATQLHLIDDEIRTRIKELVGVVPG